MRYAVSPKLSLFTCIYMLLNAIGVSFLIPHVRALADRGGRVTPSPSAAAPRS